MIYDRYAHSDQVGNRLEFLKYLANNSSSAFDDKVLNFLWDELVLNSSLNVDQESLYRWLKQVCDISSRTCLVKREDLIAFFRYVSLFLTFFCRTNMVRDNKAFTAITQEGFQCIQSFFLLINEQTKKIQKLPP